MESPLSRPTRSHTEHCPVCGGPLHGGALGPRCPRCVFALSVEVDDLDETAVAQLFPELEIEGKIARGGFGTVFRAQHRRLKRAVALKFLDPGLTHSPEAISRFEQEMESVGRLDHAGIVRAHDAGEREGRWFIVMEHVDGEDLATLSRREGQMEPQRACRLIREAARSLAYAHERGLVHRDVKPSNIMLSAADGAVKVLDFGLAVTADATLSDTFSGTPDYAAPEQIATPREVDARADVFGLGATLFRLLTGQAPHVVGGEVSMTERIARISREPPPPVQTLRKDLPAGLPAVVDRLLAMDRTKRPQSAAEVAALLAPFAGLAERKSTKWPLVTTVTAVAIFGLATVFWPAGEKADEMASKPVLAPKPAPEPPGSLAELKQKSSVIPAVFKSAKHVPLTGVTSDVNGQWLDLKLEFEPEPGRMLMALRNTGQDFILGQFENVKNGQRIELEHAGKKHIFIAWYYGGNGNDLVLLWPYTALAAWGLNNAGTLGNGLSEDSAVPVNVLPELLAGQTVVQVAAGGQHTLALTNTGRIIAWGDNRSGQLGNRATMPSRMPVETELGGALAGKRVVAVAAGGSFSLALTSEGRVFAWGLNDQGQLGDGSERTFSSEPVEVVSGGVLAGVRVTQIHGGVTHALALTSSGRVVTWGGNARGQLGIGQSGGLSRVPVALDSPEWAQRRITDIATGPAASHSLAVAEDGGLYAWGSNYFLQCGLRRKEVDRLRAALISHPLLEAGVSSISAGVTHSVVLTRDGRAIGFGGNDRGQLGIGMIGQAMNLSPVDTSRALKGRPISQLKAGSYFTAALTNDGQVFSWGSGVGGRLGKGEVLDTVVENSLLPGPVSTEKGASALAGRRVCESGLALNGNGGVVIYALGRDEKLQQAPLVPAVPNAPSLAAGWEIESVIETVKPQRCAQFMRDGSLISVAERDAPAPQVTRWVRGAGGWVAEVMDLGPERKRSWRAFVHPDSGHFVLTEPSWMLAPDRLARYTAAGRKMLDLLYSDRRYSSLEAVAFIREGAMPAGSVLRAGDVLVVDAGSGPWAGKGSLWRARLDSDEPLELLTEDELLSAPVDVAVNSRGVYLFNRNKGYAGSAAASEEDLSSRVIRWEGSRLIPCHLSQPVRDPSALVAVPGSAVLYAAEGSSGPMNHGSQRVLRLTPGQEPDAFEAEVIARSFGKLYGGALAIHPDGSLLAVTDHERKRIYLLRVKAD